MTAKSTMAALLGLALLSSVMAAPAAAEVQKFMNISNGKLQPSFRLVFTPPKGWVEDKDASKKNGVPMYVPKGKTFASAPALMYIRVSYNHQAAQSMENFIEIAHQRWLKEVGDSKIDKIASQPRADGRPEFQIYHFTNPSQQQQAFELMAYGEDKDKDGNSFFLMIALSAASQKAIDEAEASYREALKAH